MDSIIDNLSGIVHIESKEQEKKIKTKRYNLMLPIGLYEQLHIIADEKHTPVLDLLKRFIRMGLVITSLSQSRDAKLIIREGDKEREIILL